VILFVVLFWSSASFSIACNKVRTGGYLSSQNNSVALSLPQMNKSITIPLGSDVEIRNFSGLTSYASFIAKGRDYQLFDIVGETAAKIYFELLDFFYQNKLTPLCFLDSESGILFVDGISCRWGTILNKGELFRCRFFAFGDGPVKETASDIFSLPKPRMGAGNVEKIHKKLTDYLLSH
jgi:hypothetical protein